MNIYLVVVSFLVLILIYKSSSKSTLIGISFRNKQYGGLVLGKEIVLMIALGVVIYEIVGWSYFSTSYINDDSMISASFGIVSSLYLLIVSVSFFSRTIFKSELIYGKAQQEIDKYFLNVKREQFVHINIFLIIILIILAHILGVKHAVINSIISGEGLLQIRLDNKNEVVGPLHGIAYLRYSIVLLSISLGYYYFHISRLIFFIGVFLIVYSGSMFGDKSPLLNAIILFYLAIIPRLQFKFINQIILIFIFIFGLIVLVYQLALLQFPNMDGEGFVMFIFERIGTGQIRGVYEQYGLQLRNFDYIYNEIPFSGLFIDGKSFGQDLMIAASGYKLTASETGVMNSFFIGESLAIGGYGFIHISVVMVAFNFCLIMFVSVLIIKRMIGDKFDAQFIVALFVPSIIPFTTDLSGLLFGKKAIFVMIFLFSMLILIILKKSVFHKQVLVGRVNKVGILPALPGRQ